MNLLVSGWTWLTTVILPLVAGSLVVVYRPEHTVWWLAVAYFFAYPISMIVWGGCPVTMLGMAVRSDTYSSRSRLYRLIVRRAGRRAAMVSLVTLPIIFYLAVAAGFIVRFHEPTLRW